ncbi:MAG: hypothetical protein AAF658_09105 [Myxococcota bacterium]
MTGIGPNSPPGLVSEHLATALVEKGVTPEAARRLLDIEGVSLDAKTRTRLEAVAPKRDEIEETKKREPGALERSVRSLLTDKATQIIETGVQAAVEAPPDGWLAGARAAFSRTSVGRAFAATKRRVGEAWSEAGGTEAARRMGESLSRQGETYVVGGARALDGLSEAVTRLTKIRSGDALARGLGLDPQELAPQRVLQKFQNRMAKLGRNPHSNRALLKALDETNRAFEAAQSLELRLTARLAELPEGRSLERDQLAVQLVQLEREKSQIDQQSRLLKAVRGKRGLDDFGFAFTMGLGTATPGLPYSLNAGGDTNMLWMVGRKDPATGRRTKTVDHMTRGGGPLVWFRHTTPSGEVRAKRAARGEDGSDASVGLCHLGAWASLVRDPKMGDFAGYWRPGSTGLPSWIPKGAMFAESDERALAGLQWGVPLTPGGTVYGAMDFLAELPPGAAPLVRLPIDLTKNVIGLANLGLSAVGTLFVLLPAPVREPLHAAQTAIAGAAVSLGVRTSRAWTGVADSVYSLLPESVQQKLSPDAQELAQRLKSAKARAREHLAEHVGPELGFPKLTR